ncbi:MAG: hypothetical protein NVSMB23_01750 [Myxococcales bacterium]
MLLRLPGALRQNVAVGNPAPSTARPGIRLAYAMVQASAFALGVALVARPAALWLEGLGLFRPAIAARVPGGAACFVLAVLLAGAGLRVALAFARRERPRIPEHAAVLVLLGCALGVRGGLAAPAIVDDPAPALRAGLRAAAAALEVSFAREGRYAPDLAALDAALDALPPPAFVWRGRRLPFRARAVAFEGGPQLVANPGDLPGTIYVAVGPAGDRAYLTALTLREDRVETLRERGRPLILQARGGTHGELGQDLLLPAYPARRAAAFAP